MAKDLSWEDAFGLVTDMAAAVSNANVQSDLKAAWEAAGDDKARAKARSEVLMPFQTKVIAKYGYEPNQKGMMISTLDFKPWNHIPEIHELNNRIGYYINPAAHIDCPTIEEYMSKYLGPPPAPEVNAKSKPFTLETAIAMQEDLIEGYRSVIYQERLKQVVADAAGDQKKQRAGQSDAAMELVQTQVFPKYGFEVSKKGVMLSMQAYLPYNNTDPTVFKNNLIMGWLTNPSMQAESLEVYLERVMAEAEAAAAAAAQPSQAVAQLARPAQTQQAQPAESRRPLPPRVPAQILKEQMRKVGKSTSGVQRIDAQGQNAGWAPSEFIDPIVDIYDHGTYLTEGGQFAEAESLLREALQYFEEVVGEGHTYTLLCANQLCYTLHQQGRFAEGEPIGKTAVDGFKRNLGKRHEHTIAAMNNYALCCQGNLNMTGAVAILKEAVDISEQVNGPQSHATVAILSNLAETVRQDGNIAEAERMFRKCYLGEAQTNGADSLACSLFANNLAVVLRDQEKNDEARYWYERAVTGLTKYYGPDHDKVALVAKNLKELVSDPNPLPLELPRFLSVEPRLPEDNFYKPSEDFTYKPMCNFSSQALKDFGKRLQPVFTAMERQAAA